jgi:hypothetical protein
MGNVAHDRRRGNKPSSIIEPSDRNAFIDMITVWLRTPLNEGQLAWLSSTLSRASA